MSLETNFLKSKYNLHASPEVTSAANRYKQRTGSKVPNNPEDLINNYLNRFHEILDRPDILDRQEGKEAMKKLLYSKLVIKAENVPDNYFQNQKRLAKERGYGDVQISDHQKQELTKVIIKDQKTTLDTWINYLTSDDAVYPNYLKYYVFRGILELSSYDKEKHEFGKRTASTTAPFPDLNREALAYVIDNLDKKIKKQLTPNNNELNNLLSQANFAKLYAWAIEKVTPESQDQLTITEGKWIKYKRGDDCMPLVKSLQGHGTGWCTAGESTAKTQLSVGDFYVYYSKDKDNNFTIPRVAIRMEDNEIAEVRGIAKDQNLDPYISDIVKDKLTEFPDGKQYEKKNQDMETLTTIYNKCFTYNKQKDIYVYVNSEFSSEEVRFLYEMGDQIQGFGYEKDPRIEEIKSQRDFKKDMAIIYNCKPEAIFLDVQDWEANGRSSINAVYLGNFVLDNLTSFYDSLTLPQIVTGHLDLSGLTDAEGLVLPQTIGGEVFLGDLTTTEGLVLPQTIGGRLNLSGLTDAEGLVLPQTIGGGLDLSGLTDAEGLVLPQTIGGGLNLDGLTKVNGLTLPQTIGGGLGFMRLTIAEGIVFPQTIGGTLDLRRLTNAKGLVLPQTVGGGVNLEDLITAEGLVLPQTVGRDLDLRSLATAKGLKLPQIVKNRLNLGSLTTADGVVCPQTIGEELDLGSLTTAEGLVLPQTVKGDLDLGSLTTVEGLVLPRSIGRDLDLRRLTNAEGLVLPRTIGSGLVLSRLITAKGLVLPQTIGGYLNLSGLTTIEGLELPEQIGEYIYLDKLSEEDVEKLRQKYPQFRYGKS